jgi:hypothetical protein
MELHFIVKENLKKEQESKWNIGLIHIIKH